MPERGGPTAQSGILYQNSVTALYMGRLCDSTQRQPAEMVVKVRVEAPESVDDTVVIYSDGHRVYIQVKENIRDVDVAWEKLWKDFETQFWNSEFQKDKDRLLFFTGEIHEEHRALKEICERAAGYDDPSEWINHLTTYQENLIRKIKAVLQQSHATDADLFYFLRHIDVDIWPLDYIERHLIHIWMPASNKSIKELFRLLRDRVGGAARRRRSFTADRLQNDLAAEDRVRFEAQPDSDELREIIKSCSAGLRQHKYTFANTGKHIERQIVGELVKWVHNSTPSENVAMLLDQAGMGKTVVARDVLRALEDAGIDVLAIKADQKLSGVTNSEDLRKKLDLPDSVERIVARLASQNLTVLLIDQIDALSLSLARDQRALDVVLELVARVRLQSNVRVLISCRIFDLHNDPRLKSIETGKRFQLTELTDDELKEVLTDLGIDFNGLTPAAQKLLRIPLHLDLFARAVESGESNTSGRVEVYGIVTLQDLYGLLWRNVILKPDPDGPSASDRARVIDLLTEYMDKEQKTSASYSIFTLPENDYLEPAVRWLASEGILLPSGTEWSFLHQTFFDYCYAKRFVESGGSISDTILRGDQGIFARPQLLQVLAYLRGTHPSIYIRELSKLLNCSELRVHLRDLVLRWFGSIPNPTDDEWVVARRIFLEPGKRARLLQVMEGNLGWFNRIKGETLTGMLAQDDQTLDTSIIPYLGSMLEVAQAEVVNIVRPFLGHGGKWNHRLRWVLNRIRQWQSTEAVDLFEELFRLAPTVERVGIHEIDDIAKVYPQAGCRLIRQAFDLVVESIKAQQGEAGSSLSSFPNALEVFNGSTMVEALKAVIQAEPKYFLDLMLPWLERAIELKGGLKSDGTYYDHDTLSYGWYETVYVVKHALLQAFVEALISVARSSLDQFRHIASRLAESPYKTPQLLLSQVYRAVPEIYSHDAQRFILADQRRLELGDHQQYDSRQVIKAIYPFLSVEEQSELEELITSYRPIRTHRGLRGLRWSGLEQFYLLQAIPREYLTESGLRCLQQLERKFPDVRPSEKPNISGGGAVGSPISDKAVVKMSDSSWLRAMAKYRGEVEHKEFLKGGAQQLGSVLNNQVKNDPDRFYRLALRVPPDTDDSYVRAFINGLADSNAHLEKLIDIIRHFSSQPERDIKQTIASALEKRAKDGLPDDLVDLLESYVLAPFDEDEKGWIRDEEMNEGSSWHDGLNRGPYVSYLISDRGSAFRSLMRVLEHREDEETRHRKWALIEFAADDHSTALRAGAIEELLYILAEDRERAITLFERLMEEHPALLRSHPTQEFLYYGLYKYYRRMRPFILALMNEKFEEIQQRGAELACIASISPKALETTEDQADAQEIAKQAITGPASWRMGAAHAYAANIAHEFSDVCVTGLLQVLDDEDDKVRQFIGEAFSHLRDEHIFKLRAFMEAYAASSALSGGRDQFITYLLEHGLLDPQWALSVTDIILKNPHRTDDYEGFAGGEELIRLVIRIYTHPLVDDATRRLSMDLFDQLMERYKPEAYIVLRAWDRR
jgi:ATPase family associated with various cellular activities (AAA)